MRCPDAEWRPLGRDSQGQPINHSPGGMLEHLGLVVHIMEGTLDGTDGWFRNPKAQASAHFGVGKGGLTYQWVDTDDKAWAQAGGNPSWVSVEMEGHAGDLLTALQMVAVAKLYAWGQKLYGWPQRPTDSPALGGLGWHGMGGTVWGGHVGCPGDPIKAQRMAILGRVTTNGGIKAMFDPAIGPVAGAAKWPDGGVLLVSPAGAVYALFGAPYLGGANGQDYFVGRAAAGFVTDGSGTAVKTPQGGYTIQATSGEKYNYNPKS
jgi:hypothetical protein